LGVNRTWVKYVEKGRFPNTRRYFQVTRCNHCADPYVQAGPRLGAHRRTGQQPERPTGSPGVRMSNCISPSGRDLVNYKFRRSENIQDVASQGIHRLSLP
jgi:hypothetical protein